MLITLEGHYLRSIVLETRRLRGLLEADGAGWDTMGFFGVVEAAFTTAVAQLRRGRFGHNELERFAERAAAASRHSFAVTADEVSRTVRLELGEQVTVTDIAGRLEIAVKTAVVAGAVRHLRMTLNDLENLITRAELLAEQWGFDSIVYRPGLLARLLVRLAEARWSAAQLRRGRRDECPTPVPRHAR